MRFEVKFPNNKSYKIGGVPLCTMERLSEMSPDLVKAINADNETVEQIEELIFQIVKFYNPDVDRTAFIVDVYTATEVQKIWCGEAAEEKKSETYPTTSDT